MYSNAADYIDNGSGDFESVNPTPVKSGRPPRKGIGKGAIIAASAGLVLLGVMAAMALVSARGAIGTIRRTEDRIPAEVYALYQAKSGRAQYLLREKDGLIAVYKSGENRPEQLTDIETALLRRADRAMLKKGIPAEDLAEVLALLEDFGS